MNPSSKCKKYNEILEKNYISLQRTILFVSSVVFYLNLLKFMLTYVSYV